MAFLLDTGPLGTPTSKQEIANPTDLRVRTQRFLGDLDTIDYTQTRRSSVGFGEFASEDRGSFFWWFTTCEVGRDNQPCVQCRSTEHRPPPRPDPPQADSPKQRVVGVSFCPGVQMTSAPSEQVTNDERVCVRLANQMDR